jgi:hypothetical protein
LTSLSAVTDSRSIEVPPPFGSEGFARSLPIGLSSSIVAIRNYRYALRLRAVHRLDCFRHLRVTKSAEPRFRSERTISESVGGHVALITGGCLDLSDRLRLAHVSGLAVGFFEAFSLEFPLCLGAHKTKAVFSRGPQS